MQSVSTTYPEKPSTNMTSRVFAVLALIIAGIVVAALVAGSIGSSSSSSSSSSATASQTSSGPKDKYFVVQAGDNLSSIAAKEGVTQQRLEQLNPNLDPQNLQPQNCVDLVPNGCRVLAKKNGG
jgi:LysM repeat protein